MRSKLKNYFNDLKDDLEELGEDFRRHFYKPFKKPYKVHSRVKIKMGKRGRPALALAERIRGAIYVIVSMSIIYTTFITLTEGVTGLTEIVMFLINSFFGRILVFFIGFAYLIYGIWKIVMGCD
jgi:hypothetical protein